MIGYKAMLFGECNPNLDDNPTKYKSGKTYELTSNPVLCKNGFHFCKKLDDVFCYYDHYDAGFEIYFVEALGKTRTKGNKSCTNKIKIIRKLRRHEINSISKTFYINQDGEYKYKCDIEQDLKDSVSS